MQESILVVGESVRYKLSVTLSDCHVHACISLHMDGASHRQTARSWSQAELQTVHTASREPSCHRLPVAGRRSSSTGPRGRSYQDHQAHGQAAMSAARQNTTASLPLSLLPNKQERVELTDSYQTGMSALYPGRGRACSTVLQRATLPTVTWAHIDLVRPALRA